MQSNCGHPLWARRLTTVMVTGVLLASCGGSKSTTHNAADLLNQGIKAQVAGDNATATAKFNQIIKVDPKNKIAYYDLGLIKQNTSNPTGAEVSYRAALAIDPEYAPALYNLGIIRANAGSQAEAVDLYTRATVAAPKEPTAFLNLGLLLYSMGNAASGRVALATAVQLDPGLASRIPAADQPTA